VALFIIVNFNLKNKEQQRVGLIKAQNPTQPKVTFFNANSTFNRLSRALITDTTCQAPLYLLKFLLVSIEAAIAL
jgi:hypothetical protein